MRSISETLKTHVKHNVANVISRAELQLLSEQVDLMASIKEELEKHSAREDLKEQLVTINEIQLSLIKISTSLNMRTDVNQLQEAALAKSSDVIFYSF